jgi:flavin reductase (DIM6/NTAB) family NADH-FMN oxidoreductase RutF
MAKVQVWRTDYFAQTIQRMLEDRLLLVAAGAGEKANVMTIGWGTMGSIWSRPAFIVLVRPSRHTCSRLEQVGNFTVSEPPRELAPAVSYCGTVSGRDHDKFQEMHSTPIPSKVAHACS